MAKIVKALSLGVVILLTVKCIVAATEANIAIFDLQARPDDAALRAWQSYGLAHIGFAISLWLLWDRIFNRSSKATTDA